MPRSSEVALANIDLNLLVILRELLREQNVTRAAERVGVTQPAASAALARLRRHFDDDLLERTRGGFVLSPLGQRLSGLIEPLCLGLEQLFAPEPAFRPEESRQEFTILTTDYVLAAFGERLSRALHAAAPHVRMHVRVAKGSLPTDLVETLRAMDGIVSAPKAEFKAEDIRGLELFRDRWVCVVDADNPVGGHLELADLERMPWVIPNHPDGGYPASSPLGPLLARLTTAPRVAVRVESYNSTPWFVAGTDRVAVIQRRLVGSFADRSDLRILECPGDPPPIVETFWWHRRRTDDVAHTWLRTILAGASEPLRGDGVGV
ncbi:LysR family transcriptional regulator [Pseudonocardia sp. KRD291]|uniref:LysR family transcriptional regulator n=1 Tax=Pseudonocardia sp. KRD291 TaxID=2792007 RepID=UPI001C4A5030|nr:LysR family transcriptional regulator [Pseudonocardia sp. KRD291]MBW0104996.1 LysR family transcriptional regulator [Pseudonocardia sp. KRD291]